MSWALHFLCAEILPKAVGNKTCLTLFIGLNLCSTICATSLIPTTLYCGMFILYLCLLKCHMWYDFCHKTCLSFVCTLSKHWSHILIVKGLSVLQLIAFVMLQKKRKHLQAEKIKIQENEIYRNINTGSRQVNRVVICSKNSTARNIPIIFSSASVDCVRKLLYSYEFL